MREVRTRKAESSRWVVHEGSRSNGVGYNRDPEGASSPDLRSSTYYKLRGRETRLYERMELLELDIRGSGTARLEYYEGNKA
ncbi:hypothetical protein NDU88_007840 [Pleurodeles waltl]|uniref:Uncharacterized protein n=1 Tax=Pleurodeles waltl TaxID=8319 RepID=A0AAV7VTH7_PLEWA|nr:hypothetical protein NDU88_007840 [Pleurodeles waltl]